MRKKICFVLLVTSLLTGCVSGTKNIENGHIKVLTSFYPMYLLAQEVTKGVDGIDLYNMAQPQTGCLHDYTLSTGDMQKLQEADILLVNGGGMEGFLDQALEQFPDLVVVDTSEGIDLLPSEQIHHHEEEHEHEHQEDMESCKDAECGNSHIWLSLGRVQKQVNNIALGLAEVIPEEKEIINNNAEVLMQQVTALQEEAEINHGKEYEGINVAVFHEGFEYLTEPFHMNACVQIFMDENEEPSAKELAAAVDEIRSEKVQFYLVAEDAGKKYAEVLAKECGGQIIVLNPMTGKTGDQESYILAMKDNVQEIKRFLEGEHHDES